MLVGKISLEVLLFALTLVPSSVEWGSLALGASLKLPQREISTFLFSVIAEGFDFW